MLLRSGMELVTVAVVVVMAAVVMAAVVVMVAVVVMAAVVVTAAVVVMVEAGLVSTICGTVPCQLLMVLLKHSVAGSCV